MSPCRFGREVEVLASHRQPFPRRVAATALEAAATLQVISPCSPATNSSNPLPIWGSTLFEKRLRGISNAALLGIASPRPSPVRIRRKSIRFTCSPVTSSGNVRKNQALPGNCWRQRRVDAVTPVPTPAPCFPVRITLAGPVWPQSRRARFDPSVLPLRRLT